MRHRGLIGNLFVALGAALLLSGCLWADVRALSSDEYQGRETGTAGADRARRHIISRIRPHTVGAVPGASGDRTYRQVFPGGVNVVGIVPGTDLAHEYVVVGAHYDHEGSGCRTTAPADTICNGATDNATGVAAVIDLARRLAESPGRRSVVIALWDAEEQGLAGSRHYVANPLVPLERTVGYVNFDIMGANLLPSLRTTSFAIGAESGGPALVSAVRSAVDEDTLDVARLSAVFGQYRSDYASFLQAEVPSVFFTDSTGPCYHTAQDEIGVVDFPKLGRQTDIAERVVRSLADTTAAPRWTPAPTATYDDALAMLLVLERALVDRARFTSVDQNTITRVRDDLRRMRSDGRAAFDDADLAQLLSSAASAVKVLTHGECDGFLVGD